MNFFQRNGVVFLGASVILFLIALTGIEVILEYEAKNTALTKQLDSYRTTYRYVSGDSQRFGPYKIFSPDGGLSWYDVQITPYAGDQNKVYILGETRPELLRYTQALDEIAKRGNSFNIYDPKDRALIEDLGFEVLGGMQEDPQ